MPLLLSAQRVLNHPSAVAAAEVLGPKYRIDRKHFDPTEPHDAKFFWLFGFTQTGGTTPSVTPFMEFSVQGTSWIRANLVSAQTGLSGSVFPQSGAEWPMPRFFRFGLTNVGGATLVAAIDLHSSESLDLVEIP